MTLIPPAYECPTVHPCDTMRHDNELVPYPEKVKANFRAGRDWQLDDDFEYAPEELDRSVQTPDQIRTIARTLRDRWQSDLFPQRQELPKTLVFAKDDNHADTIVEILRQEFGRGNEFAQKITYRTTGDTPENLLKAFRTSYYPRIAVTVDMIATGTDIKPVEIVVFMRSVKSRSFFEQMKGRGVRVIKDDDLRGVNPGEHVHKDHFVIVDCVGVCERDKTWVEGERVVSRRDQLEPPAVALRDRTASMRLAA